MLLTLKCCLPQSLSVLLSISQWNLAISHSVIGYHPAISRVISTVSLHLAKHQAKHWSSASILTWISTESKFTTNSDEVSLEPSCIWQMGRVNEHPLRAPQILLALDCNYALLDKALFLNVVYLAIAHGYICRYKCICMFSANLKGGPCKNLVDVVGF